MPVEAFAAKIRACVAARDASRDPDFVICARTDARHAHCQRSESRGMDAVVERAIAYVREGNYNGFPQPQDGTRRLRGQFDRCWG